MYTLDLPASWQKTKITEPVDMITRHFEAAKMILTLVDGRFKGVSKDA